MDVAMFDERGELQPKGASNMLRPETVEALFYMWRVTGEPKYREWGWRIFEAFRKHSRTPEGAFACVDVSHEASLQGCKNTQGRRSWQSGRLWDFGCFLKQADMVWVCRRT